MAIQTNNFQHIQKPDILKWLTRTTSDWGIIIASMIIAGTIHHFIGYFIAVLIIGNRQHALAIMGHDGAHRSASRIRWLNDTLSCIMCFWPLGAGLRGYRKFHFAHHRHVGTERDPELEHKRWSSPQWALPVTSHRIKWYFIQDILGLHCMEIAKMVCTVKPAGLIDIIGPLLWWSCMLTVLYLTDNVWVLMLWFMSIGTSFWAFFRLRLWGEHVGTPGTHRVSVTWLQKLIFAPHNTLYHYEHHKWPSIPCWALPKARLFDNTTPIVQLSHLLDSYKQFPKIASGAPLRYPMSREKKIIS